MDIRELNRCLQAASVPLLLMCLVQITGDPKWMNVRYRPQRDRRLFHDETGGIDVASQEEIRQAMSQVLTRLDAGDLALPTDFDQTQIAELMRICVADEVPDEYVPMLMEELCWSPREVQWFDTTARVAAAQRRVLVVGAGMSGICIASHLIRLGFDITVVERQEDVGGVWMENDYPDAGVDTPNQFYSYSFAPRADWSRYFSKRDEVLAYFRQVATDHGVRSKLKLRTAVKKIAWIEEASKWEVELQGPDDLTVKSAFDFVICAVGQMNQPKIPDVPGIAEFGGTLFHSARWPNDVELAGRRVVVVGAGASAVQLMRPLAAKAGHVTLLQRSPQWVLPLPDYHRIVGEETKWLLKHVPYYQSWYRFGLFWRFSDGILKTLRKDPTWPYPERSVNATNDRNRELMTAYLQERLAGREDLIPKLLPNYPPYGKRILIDNEWFDTLRQPHVTVATAGLKRFAKGLVIDDSDNEHQADVVILATGFEAAKMLHTMDIHGRGGRSLKDQWHDDGPRAFLGLAIPSLPNFFCLYGPNSNLGHGGSAIFQAECQSRYISSALVQMVERSMRTLEISKTVHDEYNELLDREHETLVWSHPGTTNWFRNEKGRVFSIMPWRMVDFWRMTHDPDLDRDWRMEA